MTSQADVLNVYRSYLGIREEPPHSNDTPIGERFGWNGVPWCAEDFSLGQREAGNTSFQGSASCSVLVGRYEDGTNGTWLGNPGAGGIEPADEFFIGSRGQDHTGCVEYVEGDTVHTLEGNWGDADVRVARPVSAFYGFGRPRYDDVAAPGLPPASATVGRPWLRLGNTGEWVGKLQSVIGPATGMDCTVDNDFGQQTEDVLKAYQTKRGLEVDGVCGPATWADIDLVIAYVAATQVPAPTGTVTAVPGPADIPPFPGSIQHGSHGQAVVEFQYKLISRGWDLGPGGADGIDGDRTTAVLTQFQAQAQSQGYYSDTIDGIGGPHTWVALFVAPVI